VVDSGLGLLAQPAQGRDALGALREPRGGPDSLAFKGLLAVQPHRHVAVGRVLEPHVGLQARQHGRHVEAVVRLDVPLYQQLGLRCVHGIRWFEYPCAQSGHRAVGRRGALRCPAAVCLRGRAPPGAPSHPCGHRAAARSRWGPRAGQFRSTAWPSRRARPPAPAHSPPKRPGATPHRAASRPAPRPCRGR
nr:hypothetical protein [Tanacetum cinerariifolium]